MCAGRDLPWLQQMTGTVDVWAAWDVTYRDVVIVDPDNVKVDVYNLTTYDLLQPEHREELKNRLRAAAQ